MKYNPLVQWLAERGVKRGKKPKYAGKVDICSPDKQFLKDVQIGRAKSA